MAKKQEQQMAVTSETAPTEGPIEDGRILKMSEVAEILGVHRSTILIWIRTGMMKYVRMPSGVFGVPESQVLEVKRIRQNAIA